MSVEIYTELLGKTISEIGLCKGNDLMRVRFSDGSSASWFHEQDCCEHVDIEDVCGDPEDLVGSPLVTAERVDDYDGPRIKDHWGSYTWTFYRFATERGSVTVRWFGESNGYYS